MGKNKSQKEISQYIFDDYVDNKELINSDRMIDGIKMLMDNKLAVCIKGRDYLDDPGVSMYKLCSLYMCKKNKDLNNYKRKNIIIGDDYTESYRMNVNVSEEVRGLSDEGLEDGIYYAILGDEKHDDYAILKLETTDRDDVNYSLYFVGKKCIKHKNKFFKLVEKYSEYEKNTKCERITYTDGRPYKLTTFKSFDQMIFKDKEKYLRFVDNWVNNIPKIYKYGIIPKLSILLYGPPGTGKSTFSRALAKYLDIDMVRLISPDFFDPEQDNNRRERGGSSHCPFINTIDDIDCITQSREANESSENGAILSNILEFLDNPDYFYMKANDGIYYPVSIVVATTNYIDRLDDAIKRYGRFDLKIEMDMFDKKEAEDMCALYGLSLKEVYKKPIDDKHKASPSELQALCVENIDKAIKTI